jgi:hypothetical protein
MRSYVALATAAFVGLLAPCSRGDDTSDCIAASEQAQSLRDRRALLEAEHQFSACASDRCPGPIRADCIAQEAAVQSALPTVVFQAKDTAGNDAVDVRVVCDGAVLTTKLDGAAIPVNPGPHTCEVDIPGTAPLERTWVVAEGEKNRLLVAVAPLAVVEGPGPPSVGAAAPVTPTGTSGAVSMPGVVVGAIGLAATVPMAVLWAIGTSDVRSMRDTCAPAAGGTGCPADRVDAARTALVAGDVFLGVAAAGLVTGAVLLLTHRGGAPHAPSAAAVQVGAAPSRGGVTLSATVGF